MEEVITISRSMSIFDVVAQYDYIWCRDYLKMAEELCDRLNKEAEIGRPHRPHEESKVRDDKNN